MGTWYGVVDMPHSGPVPQEGRVWHSADGRSWEDVTPERTFADAGLSHVYQADDGTLIVLGTLHEASEDATPMAWESADGRDWSETSIGLTGYWRVERLAHGARGYLALISIAPDIFREADSGLWLSADGRSWEMVRAAATGEQFFDIGAGDDGFAATGSRGEDFEPFTIASSDGRTWIDATTAAPRRADRGPRWRLGCHRRDTRLRDATHGGAGVVLGQRAGVVGGREHSAVPGPARHRRRCRCAPTWSSTSTRPDRG